MKYFRGEKSLLVMYENLDRGAMSVKCSLGRGALVLPAWNANAHKPATAAIHVTAREGFKLYYPE
jgi:hypothetical protein